MLRRLMASAAFAVALLAVAAFARQPEPAPAKKDAPKAVDPLEARIASALVHDADIKLAQAKVQMAEAELARVRQQVTQKVVALDAAVRDQKKLVATSQEMYETVSELRKRGNMSLAEVLAAREKLEAAQARLGSLETELKSLTGPAGGADKVAVRIWDAVTGKDLTAIHRAAPNASCLACHQTKERVFEFQWERVNGPVAERIRTALDKPIKLGAKDAKVTFEQAVEAFKRESGLDVPVRAEIKIGPIVSLGEELPVGAWLQLFADGTPAARILVREYGLLVTSKDLAPPDAVSVQDFWKHRPEPKPKTP